MLAGLGTLLTAFASGIKFFTGRSQQDQVDGQLALKQKNTQKDLSNILGDFDISQSNSGFQTNMGGKLAARNQLKNSSDEIIQGIAQQRKGNASWLRTFSNFFNGMNF